MSFFLPIFGNLATSPNSVAGGEGTPEPLSQTVQPTRQEPGHGVSSNLEQNQNAAGGTSVFLQQLRFIESGDIHIKEKPLDLLVQDHSVNPNPFPLESSSIAVAETFSETVVPQKAHVELPPGLAIPQSSPVAVKGKVVETGGADDVGVQSHNLLSKAFPSNHSVPVNYIHGPENSSVQVKQVINFGTYPATNYAGQDRAHESRPLENQPIPVPKTTDTALVSQSALPAKTLNAGEGPRQHVEGEVSKHSTAAVGEKGERGTRPVSQLDQFLLKGLDQIQKPTPQHASSNVPVQQQQTLQFRQAAVVQSSQTLPVTAIHADGPAGFTEQGAANSISLRPQIPNQLSVQEPARQASDIRPAIQADLVADPGVLGRGERVHSLAEASVRSVGIETSEGQSAGMGMNNFSQSQSSFQQSTASHNSGAGVRTVDARAAAFPAPALQRLQMDVQLSEHQRVQIDVGVQNRQVYAGLVMDHSVLRNLAAQFVPQLENQLAQADLELQEFSAEVREDQQQEPDRLLYQSPQDHHPRDGGLSSQGTADLMKPVVHQQEEQGMHFVA